MDCSGYCSRQNSVFFLKNDALSGAVIGGAIGGAVFYFKGQNVWTGADVSAGRSQFSFKNTLMEGGVKAPKVAVEPDVMPNPAEPSKPTASATPRIQ